MMNVFKSTMFSVLVTAMAMALMSSSAHAAGFQRVHASDPSGKPLEIGIWYPSGAKPMPVSMGPTTMAVAINGQIDGEALPLVVISHGTGGSFLNHYDTAIALANAGYVVAAVTHAGDNYADQSRSVFIMDRPAQMRRVVDYLLASWDGHAKIDPQRIGMFGFSAGGFTTLVSIGGVPDLSKIASMCREYPDDFACRQVAKMPSAHLAPTEPGAGADLRIKAAIVAAPALGYTFAPDGLRNVKIPVQLWGANDDVVLPLPRFTEAVRRALPTAPEYHVIALAGHYDFLAPCSDAMAAIAAKLCTSKPGFDRVAFHQNFNDAVLGFFNKNLRRH